MIPKISIEIIDKDSHYQLNIPTNEANKKLIENTIIIYYAYLLILLFF